MWKLSGPGRAGLEGGEARIIEDGYDRQVLRVSGFGILTVRDRGVPGWRAFEEGAERPVSPGRWREVELTLSHERDITFRYDPPGLRTGAAAMLAAGLLLLAGAVFGAPRRIRSDAKGIPPKPVVQ
jgi:hypothetical protein